MISLCESPHFPSYPQLNSRNALICLAFSSARFLRYLDKAIVVQGVLQISEGAIRNDHSARGFGNCRSRISFLFEGRRARRLRNPPGHSRVPRTAILISSPCARRSRFRSSVKLLRTRCSMATVSTPQLFHRNSPTRWTLRTAQSRSRASHPRSLGRMHNSLAGCRC
jgi:hypothetical protein